MSPAAAATKRILRRRDVMDLLGISKSTYETYISAGLLRPIPAGKGKRHTFSFVQIVQKFQLNEKPDTL